MTIISQVASGLGGLNRKSLKQMAFFERHVDQTARIFRIAQLCAMSKTREV
jgi:hypothetical protein